MINDKIKKEPTLKDLESLKFNEETGEFFDEDFDNFDIMTNFGDEDILLDDD